MTALRARALSFAWGRHSVFADISLEIEPGTVTTILGANGCGKTTLIGCLSGLYTPESGQVDLVHDGDVRSLHLLPAAHRARAIGLVPQALETSFGYTALEIVLMGRTAGCGLFSLPTREDEEAAFQELEDLGIAHLAYRRISQMSGGEQRLVLIARSLATQASVLLLDEPTAHLDFRNQLLVLDLLRTLAADRRIAVAFTTHLPTDSFSVSSRALLMYRDGRHSFGPVEEVLTNGTLREAFSVDARIVSLKLNGSRNHVVIPLKPIPIEGSV
jgi:iron complex transport system ATP-binding protein